MLTTFYFKIKNLYIKIKYFVQKNIIYFMFSRIILKIEIIRIIPQVFFKHFIKIIMFFFKVNL